jgi:hypothetical protein
MNHLSEHQTEEWTHLDGSIHKGRNRQRRYFAKQSEGIYDVQSFNDEARLRTQRPANPQILVIQNFGVT